MKSHVTHILAENRLLPYGFLIGLFSQRIAESDNFIVTLLLSAIILKNTITLSD